jgi:polysaccharide export outer membrane protein
LKKNTASPTIFFLAWITILIFSHCTPTQNAVYFYNATDSGVVSRNINLEEAMIQKNDLLSISIRSLNAEATAIFNAPNTQATSTSTSTGSTSAGGYLVNSGGNVQMPILGSIKAEGLTEKQLCQRMANG